MTRLPRVGSALIFFTLQIGTYAQQAETSGFLIQRNGDTATMTHHGNPCLTYKMADVPFKPYVRTFCTPSGVNVLRDSPHDHIHHHSLMFAVTVDGVDFWGESPNRKQGRQVHREIKTATQQLPGDRSVASVEQQLDWIGIDAAQTPLMSENRTIKAYASVDLESSLLGWQAELKAAANRDSVSLTGSHYQGLGMRFVQSMDRDGRFLYAAGEPGPVYRGKERLTSSKWVAYVAPVDGKMVTVAMFDHPQNPRHPARMFTMPEAFAYISATLDLEKRPLKIAAGRPLLLRYGVAVWDGDVDGTSIERTYESWLALEEMADDVENRRDAPL